MTPLIADNFAGGGGASTGIEAATGRAIDVASALPNFAMLGEAYS